MPNSVDGDQILFSGKNKNIFSQCHLLNFLPSMLRINIVESEG